jgi:anti-sigma factor RsiW
MRSRHVTHLITRYVHGQLRPIQRARVTNHVRMCVNCRVALAREENLAADLRHEMPLIGQASAGQLAQVWAGVWQEIGTPRPRSRLHGTTWLPGLGAMLAVLLLVIVAVPLLIHGGLRAEAAPLQPRPEIMVATASPTVGVTDEAISLRSSPTVAYMVWNAAASPVPVPGATTSPEARIGGLYQR